MRAVPILGRFLQATLVLGLLGALALAAVLGLTAQADAKQRRDRTAPSIRWKAPATAAIVSSTLSGAHSATRGRCRVSATDDVRVAKVAFHVDGRRLNTDRVAPYECRLAQTRLSPGRHVLKAVAYDAAGNRRTSKRSVRVRSAAATTTLPATATVAAPASDTAAPPQNRTLVFEDNFDGSAVNRDEWSLYHSPGHDGNGLRRPSAFSVADGQLTITASWDGLNITSGGMSHRRPYLYGRFEVRVRTEADATMQTSGVVLTWPHSGTWPAHGELDIYETGYATTSRAPFYSYLHWMNATQGNQQDQIVHQANAGDWHVMTMDWDPTAIRIYRDGALAGELKDPAKIPSVEHHLTAQLDAFSNRPLNGPVRMFVDWVRIYR